MIQALFMLWAIFTRYNLSCTADNKVIIYKERKENKLELMNLVRSAKLKYSPFIRSVQRYFNIL